MARFLNENSSGRKRFETWVEIKDPWDRWKPLSLAARKKRAQNNMKKWDRLKIAQKGIEETQKNHFFHFNKNGLRFFLSPHNFRFRAILNKKAPEWIVPKHWTL